MTSGSEQRGLATSCLLRSTPSTHTGHSARGSVVKVKIEFTVDVDVDAWATEFGVEPARVREDVKERARYLTYAQFGLDGVLR